MEQKLSEFRARKKAEAASGCAGGTRAPPDSATAEAEPLTQGEPAAGARGPDTPHHQALLDWLTGSALGRRLAVTNVTLLKVLLWLVLLGLFSELGFGLPFFLISLFYWLYEGLRSPEARRPGELSAYSVFNPDCRPLLGTLTAQQLEGEMGYRSLGDR